MLELFSNYSSTIIFVHVLSAIIWIGSMITLRVAVHPALQNIENPTIKLGKTLEIMKRVLNLVIPMIILLIVTAVIMTIGLKFKGTSLYTMVLVKEAIWTIMTIIFIIIYIKRFQAEKLFKKRAFEEAKTKIKTVPNILLPINITLGFVALYLGIVLRGF